jgi:phosphoserine aminotransferase
MSIVLNFNAGPAALPPSVLERVQAELLDYEGQGMSIMEMSHRSKVFEAINARAEATFKRLIGVGDGYRVLFLQGGASTQFATVPMNFLPPGGTADYLVTGVWGEKAIEEVPHFGTAKLAASTKDGGYKRVPKPSEIQLSDNPAYVHITPNETIQGVQYPEIPDLGSAPLVGDMSSEILSRPIDAGRFSLIYAGAQKNLGPSGLTVVLVRESWLERANQGVPTMFQYSTHVKNNSLYNTPPMFGIYILDLVLQWLDGLGGVEAISEINQAKATTIYDAIDNSGGFYRGHAEPGSRSKMNITFRLPSEDLEKKFVAEAEKAGMIGLAGHRSVGGIRASIYNAIGLDACRTLASFMSEFSRLNG